MNRTLNIVEGKVNILTKRSCLDIYVSTVFLGLSVVNEAKRYLNKPLRGVNLTMNQWLVLKIIYLNRADTPTKVANIMNVDATTITRLLDALEVRQLIERRRQISDRRVVEIHMTPKGMEIADKIYVLYEDILGELENRLTQEDLRFWKKIKRCIFSEENEVIN